MLSTHALKTDLHSVDWSAMKRTLAADHFDNGRTPEQLAESFRNSHSTCIAYDGDTIIGTARALSDGVCNAYIVDVWTLTAYRRQGIARAMLNELFAWGRELGCEEAWLGTEFDNVEANALYRGFDPVEDDGIQFYLFKL